MSIYKNIANVENTVYWGKYKLAITPVIGGNGFNILPVYDGKGHCLKATPYTNGSIVHLYTLSSDSDRTAFWLMVAFDHTMIHFRHRLVAIVSKEGVTYRGRSNPTESMDRHSKELVGHTTPYASENLHPITYDLKPFGFSGPEIVMMGLDDLARSFFNTLEPQKGGFFPLSLLCELGITKDKILDMSTNPLFESFFDWLFKSRAATCNLDLLKPMGFDHQAIVEQLSDPTTLPLFENMLKILMEPMDNRTLFASLIDLGFQKRALISVVCYAQAAKRLHVLLHKTDQTFNIKILLDKGLSPAEILGLCYVDKRDLIPRLINQWVDQSPVDSAHAVIKSLLDAQEGPDRTSPTGWFDGTEHTWFVNSLNKDLTHFTSIRNGTTQILRGPVRSLSTRTNGDKYEHYYPYMEISDQEVMLGHGIKKNQTAPAINPDRSYIRLYFVNGKLQALRFDPDDLRPNVVAPQGCLQALSSKFNC